MGGFAGEDLDIFSCHQCRLDGSGSDEFGFAGASTGVGVALSRAVCVGDCVLLRYSFCGSALSTLCMTLFNVLLCSLIWTRCKRNAANKYDLKGTA